MYDLYILQWESIITWLSSPNMINMKKNNTAQAWGRGSSAKAAG